MNHLTNRKKNQNEKEGDSNRSRSGRGRPADQRQALFFIGKKPLNMGKAAPVFIVLFMILWYNMHKGNYINQTHNRNSAQGVNT